jgi:hypothetical protein
MVTSNHVYADELTVHGEHDVKTWMQQDLKIERPGAPPPVGKSLQAQRARQAGHVRMYVYMYKSRFCVCKEYEIQLGQGKANECNDGML